MHSSFQSVLLGLYNNIKPFDVVDVRCLRAVAITIIM